ncbi:hypothetical protein PENTCL1PPCAC_20234, partial [Pristionchus entomophagus]
DSAGVSSLGKMKRIAKSVRPVKREVIAIDDEESISEQPIVKSVKREEEDRKTFGPVPPPEFVALKQKLKRKKEAKCQGICRVAKDAESDENRPEKYGAIDSEEKVKELEKKLADVSSRLAKTKKRAENVFAAKVELTRENEKLKTKHAKLKRSAMQSDSVNNELQLKLNNLSIQLEDERQKASDSQTRDHARIGELTLRLERYEIGPPPVDIDHPINIFQLCNPESNESMSYASAREKLMSVVMKLEGNYIDNKLNRRFVKLPKLYSLVLLCPPCGSMLNNTGIIQHFLSMEHQQMLIARNAAVSRAAFNFWVGKLQPQPDGHQTQQQHPAADDAGDAAAAVTPSG